MFSKYSLNHCLTRNSLIENELSHVAVESIFYVTLGSSSMIKDLQALQDVETQLHLFPVTKLQFVSQ